MSLPDCSVANLTGYWTILTVLNSSRGVFYEALIRRGCLGQIEVDVGMRMGWEVDVAWQKWEYLTDAPDTQTRGD